MRNLILSVTLGLMGVLTVFSQTTTVNKTAARLWGSFYGDSLNDRANAVAYDPRGYVFVAGETESADLYVKDAHQPNLDSLSDGFLAKFNRETNALEWATYYGGKGSDAFLDAAVDTFGNVYVVGQTNSSYNIATEDSYQNRLVGATDGFVVKFNAAGERLWSAYFGGANEEAVTGVAVDLEGSVVITGRTSSDNYIANDTSHQKVRAGGTDAFVAKFDADGVLIWSTYYGGSDGEDIGQGIACDPENNVVIVGRTTSSSSTYMVVDSAYQKNYGGDALPGTYGDAFVAKFSPDGVMHWGTYYGGLSGDEAQGVICDKSGDIYFVGSTLSAGGNVIATSDAHQRTQGGNFDAMLVKFSSGGKRIWSTYYGGAQNDFGLSVDCDFKGNVGISGNTNSPNNIAVESIFKSSYSGGSGINFGDGFVAKFKGDGVRLWSTYYGGGSEDKVADLAFAEEGLIYFAGATDTQIPTSEFNEGRVLQDSLAGQFDAFVAKFVDSLGVPFVLEPADETMFYEGKVKLDWEPVKFAANYLVQVALDSAFNQIVDQTTTDSSAHHVTSISPGYRYFWRVKAANSNLKSEWAKILRFDYAPALPTPQIAKPELNEEFKTQKYVKVQWNHVHPSARYLVQIASDTSFAVILDSGTTNKTNFVSSEFLPGHKYYCRVKAKNDYIRSVWSEYRSFIIILNLPEPILTKPYYDQRIDKDYIEFQWRNLTDANRYKFELAEDENFVNIVDSVTTEETSYITFKLEKDKNYYWRIRAYGQYAISPWSDARPFSTFPPTPQKSTLVYPENGENHIELPVELKWNVQDDADSYHLQITDKNDRLLLEDKTITSTANFLARYIISSLSVEETYYWRVRGKNDAGWGEWSETWSFSTDTIDTGIDDIYSVTSSNAEPNPFYSYTAIKFTLEKAQKVNVSIYDLYGGKIDDIYDKTAAQGENVVYWRPKSNLSSGVYMCKIRTLKSEYFLKLLLNK